MDKLAKVRAEVEKLNAQLLRGACSSQVAMETLCKEEAYNEVLAILDTMQEEPVSGLDNGDMPIERWKQAVEAASNQRNYRSSKGLTETRDDYFVDGVQWADEHPKKEHVSEEWIEELRTKLDSMSKEDFKKVFDKYAIDFNKELVSEFLNTESMIESYKQRLISQANGMKNSPLIDMCLVSYKHGINEILDTLNLSNVQRFVKNWKEPVSDDLEEASKEWLTPQLDKSYADYGEVKMMELTHFDGYAMLDAIEFGAKWQKKQDQSTIELAEDHAMLAGMEKMREEMMKDIWKSADGEDLPEIDREVIALLDNGKVVFAHRPPKFWDGKDIATGKVTRNYPKTYDKGGWNIPDVKYWLDVDLSNMED